MSCTEEKTRTADVEGNVQDRRIEITEADETAEASSEMQLDNNNAEMNNEIPLEHPYPTERYGYGPSLSFFDLEEIEHYRPGGLHPIVLGDTLNDGRYLVVNKLGQGGFATVWLCRDTLTDIWKAIKVIGADDSFESKKNGTGEVLALEYFVKLRASREELDKNHISLAQRTFVEKGPNGSHLCFVLPVAAGTLYPAWTEFGDKPEVLKDICAQMVRAMAYLHSKGICHGDFRVANLLFKIEDVDEIEEQDMGKMFPMYRNIVLPPIPATGEGPQPHLPKSLHPASNYCPLPGHSSLDIVVTDFGECYRVDTPPSFLGIPDRYAAPEILMNHDSPLGRNYGFATDIWSLGTAVCEVRQGESPFPNGDGSADSLREVVTRWEELLGPLPEPYRSVGRNMGCIDDDLPLSEPVSNPPEFFEAVRQQYLDDSGCVNSLEDLIRRKSRFRKHIREEEEVEPKPCQELEWHDGGGTLWTEYQTPPGEADQLFDLLTKIFRYAREDRLPISAIMAHPWFAGRFSAEECQSQADIEKKWSEVMERVDTVEITEVTAENEKPDATLDDKPDVTIDDKLDAAIDENENMMDVDAEPEVPATPQKDTVAVCDVESEVQVMTEKEVVMLPDAEEIHQETAASRRGLLVRLRSRFIRLLVRIRKIGSRS